ncbi:MAG: lipoate--protein ligase [Evtepia sp.]
MIRKLSVVQEESYDPYHNLAVEQTLMETVRPDECILYLWQNQKTVVIGRNQNAWRECRAEALSNDGGQLARRLSGGGAVYHDLGNLNFTFLLHKENYDLSRQLNVILEACRILEIPAERSGRNDIVTNGRKFSGNAFYTQGERSYHHGTLLLDVDTANMGRYLNPSTAKLAAKGIASVRSRVINLKELCPGLTISFLQMVLMEAFSHVYGLSPHLIQCGAPERVAELTKRNASWDWLYGQPLPFTCACEARFSFGELRVEFQVKSGLIYDARVYSDAMDWDFAAPLQTRLIGCRFDSIALEKRLCSFPLCDELLTLFRTQLFSL